MQTVMGLFENIHAAQAAAQQLLSNGFTSKNIDVSLRIDNSSTETFTRDINYSSGFDGVSSASHNVSSSEDKSFGNKIFRFFKNSFGNNYGATGYLQAADRAGSVVTVQAYSVARAERAVDILDEYGAVDVNESATEFK